ncbi:hypothetical protein SASC598O02_005590 [Snodgrassella alvi SCGC AB-598-O02]|nr:hypothetical protein SASC598O02_005590 [Snodgrassella alvi SCGC AB-598-O02]
MNKKLINTIKSLAKYVIYYICHKITNNQNQYLWKLITTKFNLHLILNKVCCLHIFIVKILYIIMV